MDDIKAKQQVVEKIKEASKILVTVSNSPSVDALSAALGLTLLFDKQEKYATAIFSGEVPPAIAFLEPEKTFDETTDSLRDFIIALNKEKADHLRYKVEGDSVRIFITPYKTTISKDDLEFSQGAYNVELVIALGVENQSHLDQALEDHGQILHDATVITVSAGDQTSDLGGIDWHDANASSLSEMIAGLAEALKDDKKKPLVDAPIATALLTGIVAETERFSNEHTTSKAMTVAAQLMSAGADQQLIATELQTPAGPVEAPVEEPVSEPEEVAEADEADEVAEDGSQGNISIKKDELSIEHEDSDDVETLAELDERVRDKAEDQPEEADKVEETEEVAEPEAEETPVVEEPEESEEPEAPQAQDEPIPDEPETPAPQDEPVAESQDTPIAPDIPVPDAQKSEAVSTAYSLDEDEIEPSLGGTLNATSEQAAEDARREAMSGQNKTILSHAYLGGQTAQVSNPLGATPTGFPGTPDVAPGSFGINAVEDSGVHSAYSLEDHDTSTPTSAPTFGVGGEKVLTPIDANLTTGDRPTNPVSPMGPAAPADLGLPLPPPLPDFSQGPVMPPVAPPVLQPAFPALSPLAINPQPTTQPEILGDILAPEPTSAYSLEPIETPRPSNDPGQFKIPS
ncbi:MAG: hypothetical protein JWO54_102 [Candidatus Saccharibacteria bacterium]|nr:hypothetical protein [Candidatus Saccharibacteria bacterium]